METLLLTLQTRPVTIAILVQIQPHVMFIVLLIK